MSKEVTLHYSKCLALREHTDGYVGYDVSVRADLVPQFLLFRNGIRFLILLRVCNLFSQLITLLVPDDFLGAMKNLEPVDCFARMHGDSTQHLDVAVP